MIFFVLVCTLIGWLCGAPILGLLVGIGIWAVPLLLDEHDKAAARRRRNRRR